MNDDTYTRPERDLFRAANKALSRCVKCTGEDTRTEYIGPEPDNPTCDSCEFGAAQNLAYTALAYLTRPRKNMHAGLMY